MYFNIEEINRILNDIDFNNPDNYFFNSQNWDDWQRLFLSKQNISSQFNEKFKFADFVDRDLKFRQSSMSEEDFNLYFPDIHYANYEHPFSYGHKTVSKTKIQKIAFELQEHIPIEYSELCHVLFVLYGSNKKTNWNFDNLSICLMSYNKELYMKTQIYLALNSKAS